MAARARILLPSTVIESMGKCDGFLPCLLDGGVPCEQPAKSNKTKEMRRAIILMV